MNLPVPNLDDRTFTDLVLEARERIARSCPAWTDLSVHDPGMALIESFAYQTETLLYRLNRLPEKAYIAFLNLLGVTRQPPSAAWVELTFSRTGRTSRIAIPAGTRVSARGVATEPVVFVVPETAVLEPGQDEVVVHAFHCEVVEGELLGTGTGLPGQRFQAARAPIVTTAEPLDLMLGVAAGPEPLPEGATAREFGGRTYEIWRPVATFAGTGPQEKVYLLDRASGAVTFAPALEQQPLAAVPGSGREIRLWYRVGGGPDGNVAAGTLTTLRDQIAGVKVTNAQPARGGRALEALDATIARGPYEFFSAHRAVTSRDFELLATAGSGAIARAKALTRAATWSFAAPGEVEVVLVPYVGAEARPDWRLPQAVLREHEADDVRLRTQRDLDGRRALGTSCVAGWARYKTVSIEAKVVVRPEEDTDAVRRRIHERLYQAISPLPTPMTPTGWGFGEPLRASNIYRLLEQAEPGVRYVDDVRFRVEDAPDQQVRAVAADTSQPGTWYAGCGELLFRSTNDGQGWEPVGRFPDEEVRRVVPAPPATRPGMTARPGAVAVVTRGPTGSGIHLSRDLGESWEKVAEWQTGVSDLAWVDRGAAAALLLATDVGLYELSLLAGSTPLQVQVDPADPDRGFYAVRGFVSERGVPGVALAAQAQYGVYLSTEAGRPGSFAPIGLSGMDIRTLAVQLDGPATVLWAGAAEPDAERPGQGCFRARLFETDVLWDSVVDGWGGGTCWDLAFTGSRVLAATQSGGLLTLDLAGTGGGRWQAPDVNCGLPLRDRPRFEPVRCVAAGAPSLVLAGGSRGVYRTAGDERWLQAANRTTRDVVTVPETWLLCSGEHRIEVVH